MKNLSPPSENNAELLHVRELVTKMNSFQSIAAGRPAGTKFVAHTRTALARSHLLSLPARMVTSHSAFAHSQSQFPSTLSPPFTSIVTTATRPLVVC